MVCGPMVQRTRDQELGLVLSVPLAVVPSDWRISKTNSNFYASPASPGVRFILLMGYRFFLYPYMWMQLKTPSESFQQSCKILQILIESASQLVKNASKWGLAPFWERSGIHHSNNLVPRRFQKRFLKDFVRIWPPGGRAKTLKTRSKLRLFFSIDACGHRLVLEVVRCVVRLYKDLGVPSDAGQLLNLCFVCVFV